MNHRRQHLLLVCRDLAHRLDDIQKCQVPGWGHGTRLLSKRGQGDKAVDDGSPLTQGKRHASTRQRACKRAYPRFTKSADDPGGRDALCKACVKEQAPDETRRLGCFGAFMATRRAMPVKQLS